MFSHEGRRTEFVSVRKVAGKGFADVKPLVIQLEKEKGLKT